MKEYVMDIKKIEENINTKYLGKTIIYHKNIDSTQKEAKKLAIQNIQNGSIIIADQQTAGVGTHGRTWLTEIGKNIIMTLIIYPKCNINKLDRITIDISECLVNVIGKLYNIKLDIKKPNDLILNNRKIGGILTETRVENEIVKNLFIGIGFNVNQEKFTKEIKNIATSLKKEFSKEFQREEIIIEFINSFENILEEIIK